jgi:hypothetical protein
MLKPKVIRFIFILIVLNSITACNFWSPYMNQTTKQTGEIVPAIANFSGKSDLLVVPGKKQEVAFGQEIQPYSAELENGNQARYEINVQTGEVVGYYLLGQPSQNVKIDLPAARQIAHDFAATHYPKFKELGNEPHRVVLIDRGSEKNYFLRWVRVDPTSGAFLPQEVSIWVNPETGQVINYLSRDIVVTVSTQPEISRDQAVEIAKAQAKYLENMELINAVLFVSTVPVNNPKGEQALLWNVTIKGKPDATGYTPGLSIYIDAQTGKVVYIEPFA